MTARPGFAAMPFAAALFLAAAAPAAAAATDWLGDRHAAVRLITASDAASGTAPIAAGLQFRFASGWHGYWRTPGDAGIAPMIDWSATPGLTTASVDWPAPHRLVVDGLQNGTYDGTVVLPVTLAVADPTAPVALRVSIDYAACSNVCVPYHADLALALPRGTAGPSPEAAAIAAARARVPGPPAAAGIDVQRQSVTGTGPDRRLAVTLRSDTLPFVHPDLFVENAGDGLPPAPLVELGDGGHTATLTARIPEGAEADPARSPGPLALTVVDGDRAASFTVPARAEAAPQGSGLWAALLSALLGGLILNLMPCVLPVLSIKLVGLTRQAGAGRRATRIGFAATGLGIVTCYLAIAVALVVLKRSGASLGWGIQFQQPWFLAGMAVLTVLFASSLFDWIHIGLPRSLAGLGDRGGPPIAGAPRGGATTEAFLTGAFATLLATPCSAPFVGTAVGFALARGPAEILGIFLCLGLGMALPFIAAALVPDVARWLPRPGPWMITLRRVLGIMLLGTTIWLLVVLWSVAGAPAASVVALLLAGLLALAALAAFRQGPTPRRWPKPVMAALSVLVVAAALAAPPPGARAADEDGGWQAYDPVVLEKLVKAGNTVLVDVSASWCLTCKVNELAALKTADVENRLSRPGTARMRADWSRPDPTIARYIQSFGRYGIPLDVIYGPGRPTGELLPELLTAKLLLGALDRAAGGETRPGAVP